MQHLKELFAPRNLRRNWWVTALLLVEAVFLLVLFAGDYRSGQAVDVTPDLIIPYIEECTNDDRGARIENYTGVFATTRWIDIQPGSYQVSITYVTNGNDGSATFVNQIMPTARYDPITLPAARTRTVFSLWMPHGCETAQLQFSADCGEDQVMYITGVQLTPTHGYAYVRFLTAFVFFALADYLLLLWKRRLPFPIRGLRNRYAALALTGIVLFACLPLGLGYLPYGHDLSIHLTRIEGLKNGLLAGQFPVRMDPAIVNDKGYPFSLMYSDLLLYPAAILRILGFSLQTVYRLYVLGITVATALVTHFVLRRMLGSARVALVGTALYVLSFYRLTNVFVRAAVGEYSAMVFLPLVVYGLWRIYTQELKTDRRSTPWCWLSLAIGFTGLLQTHLLTTEMAALFTALFCLLRFRQTFTRPVLPALCKAVGAAVVWNLWFLVPLLQYMALGVCNISGKYDASALHDSAAFPAQIFMMFGGTGVSDSLAEGMMDEMPLSVGTVLAFGAGLFLLVVLDPALKRADRRALRTGSYCFGFAALALWMASTLFPWYELFLTQSALSRILGKLQFAWRFLSLGTVLLVGCTCCALVILGKARRIRVLTVSITALLALTVLPAGQLLHEVCRNSVVVSYESLASIDTLSEQVGGGEYLPSAAVEDMGDLWGHLDPYFSEGVECSEYTKDGLTVLFSAHNTTEEPGTVVLPLFAYPGYHMIASDGAVLGEQGGYLTVTLPAGWNGSAKVDFRGLWYWRVADLVSLVGIWITAMAYAKARRATRNTVGKV